jgi:rubrerythrin
VNTVVCDQCGFGVILTTRGIMSRRTCPVCKNKIRRDKKGNITQGECLT